MIATEENATETEIARAAGIATALATETEIVRATEIASARATEIASARATEIIEIETETKEIVVTDTETDHATNALAAP